MIKRAVNLAGEFLEQAIAACVEDLDVQAGKEAGHALAIARLEWMVEASRLGADQHHPNVDEFGVRSCCHVSVQLGG